MHTTSPFRKVTRSSFHLLIRTFILFVQHANTWSSSRSLTIHFSFNNLPQLSIASHYMTNPILFPLDDHINQYLLFTHNFQHSFIGHFSVQLIFSIRLHNHISKAFNCLLSSSFNVHVSAPYNATLHTILIMFFLTSLLIFLVRVSFSCQKHPSLFLFSP